MQEYHKIHTIFKRDMSSKRKPLLEGQWSSPEFEFLAGNVWTFTEKVNGTNIRVMFKDGVVTFGGKTDASQIPAQLVKRLNERFLPLSAKLQEVFGGDVCLYGEGYGAKIQNGGNYRQDQDFVLFDCKVGNWWLQRADVEDVAQKLDLDVVPIIGEGTLHEAVEKARAGLVSTWGNFQAEGIVARPKTELKARNGQRIIAKIKCRDFKAPARPVTGKDLWDKLRNGITCEVPNSDTERLSQMLRYTCAFHEYTVQPSDNKGWLLFKPEVKARRG